jgi:hypothetical protein
MGATFMSETQRTLDKFSRPEYRKAKNAMY